MNDQTGAPRKAAMPRSEDQAISALRAVVEAGRMSDDRRARFCAEIAQDGLHRVEAMQAAKHRGHMLDHWQTVKLQDGRTIYRAECLCCPAEVDVIPMPHPNETHVCGTAVAVTCGDSSLYPDEP